MHPGERAERDQEEQHETAGPQAGQVEQHAKDDRQDEAAESTDHADQAPDRTNAARIIDRDVLEHRRLAERHEKAENEDRDGEADQAHFGMEGDRPIDALNDVVGRRIGEDEGGGDGDQEGPVHHAARAVDVREVAAIGTEQAGGHREESGDHASGANVHAIDLDQVLRQPKRQRDESAKDEEIIEREAPDLNILQRLELHPGAFRLLTGAAALDEDRVIRGGEPENDRHDHEGPGPDLGYGMPSEGDQHHRCKELGNCRSDVAGAEDAKRRALFFRRIPARHIGHANRERSAGDADAKRCDQHLRIGRGKGQEEGCHRCRQHRGGENHTATVAVCPDAQRDADERAGEDRCPDKEAELGFREIQVLTDLNADDCEDCPHGETDGEGDGTHRQSRFLALRTGIHCIWHSHAPDSDYFYFESNKRSVAEYFC